MTRRLIDLDGPAWGLDPPTQFNVRTTRRRLSWALGAPRWLTDPGRTSELAAPEVLTWPYDLGPDWLSPELLLRSPLIVATTHAAARAAIAAGVEPEDVTVLPAPTRSVRPVLERKGPLRLLTVPDILWDEGTSTITRAFAGAIQAGASLELMVLAGPGRLDRGQEERWRFETFDLDIVDRLHIVAPADLSLQAALRRADLMVDLAVVPGATPAFVEARATGLPVVAVHGLSSIELVDDGRDGILVPARDPDHVADLFVQLAAGDLEPLATAAARRAATTVPGGQRQALAETFARLRRRGCRR